MNQPLIYKDRKAIMRNARCCGIGMTRNGAHVRCISYRNGAGLYCFKDDGHAPMYLWCDEIGKCIVSDPVQMNGLSEFDIVDYLRPNLIKEEEALNVTICPTTGRRLNKHSLLPVEDHVDFYSIKI